MIEHIHTPHDGRGWRRVYVNGNEIGNVIRADTRRGLVVFVPEPVRSRRSGFDEIYTPTLRGHVVVVPMATTKPDPRATNSRCVVSWREVSQ